MFRLGKLSRSKDLVICVVLFSLTFFLYLHNLSPSVYGGDVGDFLAAIAVRGVAHPPGYPLFTVLGILFSLLPLKVTLAYKVGLISVLSSSFAVVLVYLIIKKISNSVLISLLTALTIAFTYVFWLYAEVGEVFALNIFLCLFLFYIVLLYVESKKAKYLYLLSFLTGLAFTNHHTFVLLAPSVLFLLLSAKFWRDLKPKMILKMILFFLLGFSFYLYVPFAAFHDPVVNWDNARDLRGFIHLFLRKDYGTFSSSAVNPSLQVGLQERLFETNHFLSQMVLILSPLAVFLGILGFLFLWFQKKRVLALAIFLIFLLSGPLFFFYAGFPLNGEFQIGVSERFFILPFVFFSLLVPFGVLLLKDLFLKVIRPVVLDQTRLKIYGVFFILLFFILPFYFLRYNFLRTNLANVWIGDTLALDVLFPLPQNAVVFVGGDTLLFNVQYLRYGLRKRKDIKVVNLNAPIANPWYREYAKDFEKRAGKKNFKFTDILKDIASKRPTFAGDAVVDKKLWQPYGLIFKYNGGLVPKKAEFLQENKQIWSKMHLPLASNPDPAFGNLTIAEIPNYYAKALTETGNFLAANYKDIPLAVVKSYFTKAVLIAPDASFGYSGLGYVAFSEGNCQKASQMFQKVLSLSPGNKTAMILLYALYQGCLKDAPKAKQTAIRFEKTFGKPIFSEAKKMLKK